MKHWLHLARTTLCSAYKYSGAMRLHEMAAQWCGQQFMTILLYHRVNSAIPEDCLTVSCERFERTCKMLASRFTVVPLGEMFRILRTGEPMPRRTVAITFDDSYRDNLEAARTLSRYGLPATFFLPTSYIGTNREFDWDRALPQLPNLTWDDVREMAAMGFEIGSHTVTHANLGAVTREVARAELVESRLIIQEQIQRPVRWFAYPFGGQHHLRPEFIPLIREAGYEGGVSAFGGFVQPGIDDTILPRQAAPYFQSLPHLEVALSGCLHWLYALKGKHGNQRTGPWPYGDAASPDLSRQLTMSLSRSAE